MNRARPARRRRLTVAAAMLAGLAMAAPAGAEPYPSRPIRLVQGFAAGGNADVIARLLGQGLSQELGQPVVVEARTGAGGNIASEAVARSPADGYTLILLTGGHAVSAAVYARLAFEPVRDFSWISLATVFPFVVATRADGPLKSMREVIDAARREPGRLSYSSVGIGTTQHLTGELLQSAAGVTMTHVPYRGGGAPVQDVIAGRVDLLFDSVTVARAQVEGGRLRALGVTSPAPIPQLPGVPAVADTLPGFEVMSWAALAAPAQLPADVLARLHGAMERVLAKPDTRRRLGELGGTPTPTTPEATERYVAAQIDAWRRVVERAGIPRN
jgi:tripartite-type tricarboxylate transporter receptor subunit TctC